jgi:methyl-accepting chemotaxis protein
VDLAQVRNVDQGLRAVESKVRGLIDAGRKSEAMRVVGSDYRDQSKKTREKLKEVTARKVEDAVESERTMYRVVRQSHFTSIAAVLLAMLLGIVLAVGLHNSVMLPMKVFSMWSEQMAKGNLHLSLNIPGNDEMGRLAKNFNEMVQNLSQHHQRLAREKDQLTEERARDIAREREMETELQRRREEQEKEDVSTLEDAVDGFREILDIMGAAPSSSREKKK